MSSARRQFEQSVRLTEPFVGAVWIRVSRTETTPGVRMVVSVEGGWDADLVIDAGAVAMLADALGGSELAVVKGETVDGESAVLVAEGDRLVVTVPRERLSDVLVLGAQAEAVRECLSAAARLGD